MIGGKIVDVWRWEKDHVSVVVMDDINGKRLCVSVEKNDDSLTITRGDSLWWQGKWAMWTSKDKSVVDRQIARFGPFYYSTAVTRSGLCPERERAMDNYERLVQALNMYFEMNVTHLWDEVEE